MPQGFGSCRARTCTSRCGKGISMPASPSARATATLSSLCVTT